jgi:hypothetical protein
VYALHSTMSTLDYTTEPLFECSDTDSSDVAFVRAAGLIAGQDVIEEYLAYDMYPLSANFGFKTIADGETPMSKVTVPLSEFHVAWPEGESDTHFLARVELEAKNVTGGYGWAEHDACMKSLLNGGHLN